MQAPWNSIGAVVRPVGRGRMREDVTAGQDIFFEKKRFFDFSMIFMIFLIFRPTRNNEPPRWTVTMSLDWSCMQCRGLAARQDGRPGPTDRWRGIVGVAGGSQVPTGAVAGLQSG